MKRASGKVWAVVAMLIAMASVFGAAPTWADTLHLNDGRVLEGRVEREGDGFVYFVIVVGGIEHTQLFNTSQIKKLERDDAAEEKAPAAKTTTQASTVASPRAISDSATRIVFVSLEEMVGPYMNAEALLRSVKLAEPENPDIVVLVINSGGGALMEVEPLSDAIHEELKAKYRVVAWVRSAISAAAMTAFNCEEIYMMRQGNIGAAVAFTQSSGGTKAADGAHLEEILILGEKLSRRGKRNPLILRSMQVFMELSCDIENGIVTWYDNLKGKYIVNPKDRILTLNAVDAEKYGISRGTADTKDELARLMGVREWVEVGHKADLDQISFRNNVKVVQARSNELMAKYELSLQAAGSGNDASIRNRYIGQARQIINELRGLVRRAPSVETYMGLTKDWFAEREAELRKLAQQNRGG